MEQDGEISEVLTQDIVVALRVNRLRKICLLMLRMEHWRDRGFATARGRLDRLDRLDSRDIYGD